jgi:hypothetical protein
LKEGKLGDIENFFSLGIKSEIEFSPAIIIWKHKQPRRYGVLELVFSKGMDILKNHFSQYENIEITGTSGYLWITPQKANIQNSPSLVLYRRDKLYIPQNLKDSWKDAFIECTLNFLNYLQGKKQK